MSKLDHPSLRRFSIRRVNNAGRTYVVLEDPYQVIEPRGFPWETYQHLLRWMDGTRDHQAIREAVQKSCGQVVSAEELQQLVHQLDDDMVLDGPKFTAFREDFARRESRLPSHAGRAYPADAEKLTRLLDSFYGREFGESGIQSPRPTNSKVRGVLSPHIDFQRGGHVYTWAYQVLADHPSLETVVILGVAHQPTRQRFTLTRKEFHTPLGVSRVDHEYLDHLVQHAGADWFEDELAHRTEHSIEFQVVFLQHLWRSIRPDSDGPRIVPILVGSFHDLLRSGRDPMEVPEVMKFITALREAELSSRRKVVYVGGIDLGHVGRAFGDPDPVDQTTQERLRRFDESMLSRAAARDPTGWFDLASRVGDCWRTCGLAATYTLLHAIGDVRGQLLRYDQAIDSERTCCVSFASMAFEAADEPDQH